MKTYILGVVLSLAIIITPALAQAQTASLTSSQINAIIQLLQSFGADQSVINNVQISLNGGTPTTGGQSFCYNFNSDLTVGNRGADVLSLKKALYSMNLIETVDVPDVFNENTAADVVSFQAKYGIRQTGYVGPMTRAKLNSLYGCQYNQQPTQSTTWTTPTVATPQPTMAPTYTCSNGTIVGSASQCPYVPAVQTSINVMYPTSGMTFTQGQPMTISWQSIGSSNAKYEVLVQNHDVNMSAGTFSPAQAHCDAADKCYITWTPTTFANSPVVVQVTDTSTFPGASGTSGQITILSAGLTSLQIQSTLSLLSSFGANSAAIANMNVVLSGGAVSNPTASGLTSAQVQSILSLLSSFGASSTMIANAGTVLPAGLTSTQIQSILSLLSSFGANSTTIANTSTVLTGGAVSTTGLTSSGLTSSQIQSILSLLSSFGANSTIIANANAVLSH